MARRLLSFAAAAVLLGAFLVVLRPERLARQLAGADLAVFTVGLVAVLGALACWSEATRRLVGATGTTLSFRRAFVAYGAGAFGKQVLPMGNAGGPAVMAFAFDRETGLGYGRSLAVVVVAEFLSLAASVVLGLIGVLALLAVSPAGGPLRWLGVAVALVAAVLVALVAVVRYRRAHVASAVAGSARLVEPAVRRLSPGLADRLDPDRVDATLRRVGETVGTVVGDRRAVLVAAFLSQLGWVCFAVPLYTGALALGVDLPLGLVLFLVPTAGVATAFPLPGGLGGFEVALAGLLAALAGLDVTTAGAVVILFRLCTFWFFVLVGGLCTSASAVGPRELVAPEGALPTSTPAPAHEDASE